MNEIDTPSQLMKDLFFDHILSTMSLADAEPSEDDNTVLEARALIFDGARGIYISEAIQDLAGDYGWPGDKVGVNDEDQDPEAYTWASVEAQEYLNSLCPDSYSVGYDDGDFFCFLRKDVNV